MADTSRMLFRPEMVSLATALGAVATLNDVGEKCAFIGNVKMEPGAGTKVLSSAGGKIGFRMGGSPWLNGATAVDIGIQDIHPTNGPPIQPNGTFSVKGTAAPPNPSINTWVEFAMTTGSKSISPGDMIAVVFDMTARGGTDIFQPNRPAASQGLGYSPMSVANIDGAGWVIGGVGLPNPLLIFDDGTHGILEGCHCFTSIVDVGYADSTNPDELGMQFEVPYPCMCEGVWSMFGSSNATDGDAEIKLYQSPVSSPTIMKTIVLPAEKIGSIGTTPFMIKPRFVPVELTPGVMYGIGVRAMGSANIELRAATMGNVAWQKFMGGLNFKKISRDGGSGNFTAEATPLTWYMMGPIVSFKESGSGLIRPVGFQGGFV